MTLAGHKKAVLDLRWSRDSRLIFAGSADYTVSTFDAETGARVRKHVGHEGMVNAVDVVRRGTELVVSGADDGAVSVWDPRDRDAAAYLTTDYPVLAVAVDPVGAMVYSAGVDDTISAWDVRKMEGAVSGTSGNNGSGRGPTPVFSMQGHTETVTSLRVAPDGQALLSNAMDSTVRTWNIRPFVSSTGANARTLAVYDGAPSGIEQMLLRAVWNASGTQIAAGSGSDFTAVVWDVYTRRMVQKLTGHKGTVNGVSFSPVEPILASCSSDGTIIVGELPASR